MKIGMFELIMIFVVALIVLGPDKLPVYAKKLGQSLSAFKNYSGQFAQEMNASLVEPIKEVSEPLQKVAKEISDPLNEVKQTISNIGKPAKQSSKSDSDKVVTKETIVEVSKEVENIKQEQEEEKI